VRYQLTQNPALALRLAVASLIGGAENWSVRADRTPPHGPTVAASVEAGMARNRFREEWATVQRGLGDSSDQNLVGRGYGEGQTAEAFARLLEMTDEQVLKVLAVVVAETLVAGSGLAERLGEWLQIDMRRFWKPDETFLDLLTDKEALTRMAAELGAAPSSKATGKELRGLIRRRLKGEGCPPTADWLPRYFEFPTQGYTARPVSEARAAYDKLARRGSGANPEAEDDAVFEDEETDGWAEDADEAGVEWDEAA